MPNVSQITDLISEESLGALLSGMVDIPSPTGEEAALACFMSEKMTEFGYDSRVQPLTETQANAVATRPGSGDGKTLLLYAPLDTVTSNSESEDLPAAGPTLRPDMQSHAYTENGHVFGLGAQNPKGHGACILETARILNVAGVSLDGGVLFGFGAGGMPTHGRIGHSHDSGHGFGCQKLIESLPAPDGAIIAKSGLAVTWEEVGFIWLEVTVSGSHTYVGSRHLLPYTNAIAEASKLILDLEVWFEERASILATGQVRPQAIVSQIEAGWKRMPAFTPDCCTFLIDLRFGPDMSADEAEAQFKDQFEALTHKHGINASYRRTQTINASRTDFNDPVIQTTIDCWERLKGRKHEPLTLMSGATDANIIRKLGIPTARVGLPKADLDDIDFQLGMNCASIADMHALTELLVATTLEYCGATNG